MKPLIFVLFFFSGFSTLIYEVAWVRILALTLGNTAQATSTILAVFMGGLALGAWLGGLLADRVKFSQLRLYGFIELIISLLAPLITTSLNMAPQVYAGWVISAHLDGATLTVVRLLISALLLLLPCVLMGATLPAIIRYVRSCGRAPESFAILYAINTLGAAAGSLSCCFLGFSYLGLNATILIAATINMLVGLLAIFNKSQSPLTSSDSDDASKTEPAEDKTDSSLSAPTGLLLGLSFLTGFTALSYEVLWIRMLTFYLSSLTYTFTTTVSTILLGLALGSLLCHKVVFKKNQELTNTFSAFAVMQYAAAITTLIALFATPWAASLRNILIGTKSAYLDMGAQLLFTALVSILILLIPSTFIGTLFPALGIMAASKKTQVLGRSVGIVYAANTIGCVSGSLVAGLLLMPTFGWFSSFQFTIVLSVLTGIIALSFNSLWKSPRAVLLSSSSLVLALLFICFVHYQVPVNPHCKLLFYGEDSLGTIEIVDDPKIMEGKTLVFNGSCLATTIPNSLRYMRLLGHLPVLLHPDPKTALVGCFGTGSTCGSIALHPEIKKLDIVELSPMILKQNKLFSHENHKVLDSPKVAAHINDVRNYLLCKSEKYDIVSFEPPPPTDAGTVSLYTSEFYELVQSRLNKNGIMCQWAPMNCGSKKLWKMVVATARTVFPYVSVWLPNSHEAVIFASDQPLRIDFDQISARIENAPEVKESLNEVGMGDAMALISTFAVGGKELDEFLGDVPAITDNYPSLEFFLPYAGMTLGDIELEEPGLKQIDAIAVNAGKAKSFDKEKFARNWTALHLLRTAQYNDKDGDQCIDQALKLVPDNLYFQWIARHKKQAVHGQI